MESMLCAAIIYYNAKLVRQGGSIYFMSENYPEMTYFDRAWTRSDLGSHIHERLGLSMTQRIQKIIYRLPMGNTAGNMAATALVIRNDDDVRRMFNGYDRAVAYFQYIEVLVEIVEVGTNFGGQLMGGTSRTAEVGSSSRRDIGSPNLEIYPATNEVVVPITAMPNHPPLNYLDTDDADGAHNPYINIT